jgi:hypothetical protein
MAMGNGSDQTALRSILSGMQTLLEGRQHDADHEQRLLILERLAGLAK